MLQKFHDLLVSSHKMMSLFLITSKALNVISSKLPIGVETIYKPDNNGLINND